MRVDVEVKCLKSEGNFITRSTMADTTAFNIEKKQKYNCSAYLQCLVTGRIITSIEELLLLQAHFTITTVY